jgi:hypothetical protein
MDKELAVEHIKDPWVRERVTRLLQTVELDEWVRFWGDDTVQLDGDFTAKQLRTLAACADIVKEFK